jgi:acyl-CoA reductase-like NAD-dependent aldehyde dehydrogenase
VREHLLYIGGDWRAGEGGGADAASPATGQVFARTAVGGPGDVDAAVTAAAAAWPDWAAASPFERAEACGLVATAVAVHRDDLADVLTRNQGKPPAEALPRPRRPAARCWPS